jgi:LacI family transcriptional regulator
MSSLKEISKITGVSIATVSRVLNGDVNFKVSDQTRQSILETAEILGYRHRNSSVGIKTIGIVTWFSEKEEILDPFYLSIRLGVEKRADKKQIRIHRYFRKQGKFDFSNQQISGLIAIGKFTVDDLKQFNSVTKHIVFIDDSPNDHDYDSVVVDYEQAVNQALDYLYEIGHSRIGYIGGRDFPENSTPLFQDLKERAYIDYMRRKGLFRLDDLYIGRYTIDDGYNLAMEMLQKQGLQDLPTALFISSDILVPGVLRALYDRQISVPDEMSIVGFHDDGVSQYFYPAITTTKVYGDFMGEEAVNLMMERLEQTRSISKKIIVPTKLLIRESTAAPRG